MSSALSAFWVWELIKFDDINLWLNIIFQDHLILNVNKLNNINTKQLELDFIFNSMKQDSFNKLAKLKSKTLKHFKHQNPTSFG